MLATTSTGTIHVIVLLYSNRDNITIKGICTGIIIKNMA